MISVDAGARGNLESMLRAVAAFVSRDPEGGFFDELVAFAAGTFGVDYAHVAFVEPDHGFVRTRASWLDEAPGSRGYVYALADTPCADVLETGHRCFSSGVRTLFPTDRGLERLSAESYIGEAIRDADGKAVGLIVLVARGPQEDTDAVRAGLRILAARAGGEFARERSRQLLRASEGRFRAMAEQLDDWVWVADTGLRTSYSNGRGAAILGYDREALADLSPEALVHPEDLPLLRATFERAVAERTGWQGVVLRFRHRDGGYRVLESNASALIDESGQLVGFHGVDRDVTQRRQAERRLLRQNRVLGTIAAVSRLLAEDLPERSLLERACQTLVGEGRFRMAWIGCVGDDGIRVKPIARAGFDRDYLASADIRCDDSPQGRGPTGSAIRLGRTIINRDSDTDEIFEPWRDLARAHGYRSSAATPLRVAERAVGVLNLYSDEPDAFGPDEVVLIEKMAADLGAALERRSAAAALRESEGLIRLLLDSTEEAIYGIDIEGRCTFVNPACLRLLGYEKESDLLGRNLHALIHHSYPDGRPYPKDECRVRLSALEGRTTHVDDEVNFRADGSSFPVEYWSHPMYRDGELVGAVVTFFDITERRRSEQALRESERRYRALFEASGDGILVTHGEHIVDCNTSVLQIFRCERRQLLGRSVLDLSPEQQPDGSRSRERGLEIIRAVEAGATRRFDWMHLRVDGTAFDAEVSLTSVTLEGETHLIAAMRDVSERKQARERIDFLAHHDALTGLPNRVLLRDRFEQAVAFAHRTQSHVAMLFVDLDHFKMVNDTLGHAAGDRLLRTVADRLSRCVRETDTVSRQGGDEFIVLLNEIPTVESVEYLLAEMLPRLAEPVDIDGHILNTASSIGVCLFPQDGGDFDTLLQKADTAMYNAKDAGRNTYRFFDEEMNRQAHEHLLLQNRLHQALARGELSLRFQPQVETAGGRVFGVEALLRWNNPELGEIPPDRFIPVAEACGLIVPIGRWVLAEACRWAARWQGAAVGGLSVSVNLSALQIRGPDLVDSVRGALYESGLPPALLELELTESVLLEDMQRTAQTLKRLKALGVRLAIDDFGKGYSSLSYLRRFEVDKLKIDRSFVLNMGADPDGTAIVEAILHLAASLRLAVLAEGVETEDQLAFLSRAGCREIQGFLVSRPLTPEALEGFLAARKGAG